MNDSSSKGRPVDHRKRREVRNLIFEMIQAGNQKQGDPLKGYKAHESLAGNFEFSETIFDAVMEELAADGIVERETGGSKFLLKIEDVPVRIVNGFYRGCQECIGLVGDDKVTDIDYKDTFYDCWLDVGFDIIRFLRSQISSLSSAERIRVALQDPNKLSPIVHRYLGLSEKYASVSESLMLQRAFRDESLGSVDHEDQAEVETEIRQNANQVRSSLVNNLRDLMVEIQSLRNREKEGSYKKSVDVRCFRSWYSFPSFIINDKFAVIGFFPTNANAGFAPALIVQNAPYSPLFEMARTDFEATFTQSIPVLAHSAEFRDLLAQDSFDDRSFITPFMHSEVLPGTMNGEILKRIVSDLIRSKGL